MKIGFIGMGIMGSRMAANLLKHGHALVVSNRTRAKAEALLAENDK
ncbi:MAG TPA: NAD(P)-binding domain-containing protein [Tepidisphaeraceae bacterium]|nr:NAD(P)-binding domain-containing protein [Tepidisphaeraceae bacterium]